MDDNLAQVMEVLEAEFLAEDPDLDVIQLLIETLRAMGKREKTAPFDESDRKWTCKNFVFTSGTIDDCAELCNCLLRCMGQTE